jgi:DNA-directed RNA polymerase specialized sigma24 family protein
MGIALLLGRIHASGRVEVKSTAMDPNPDLDAESPAPKTRLSGQSRELTQEALECFLKSLGPDRDTAGARYLEVHRNLMRFFEWRCCPFPEDHADEVITRVARRLAEGEEIRDTATYAIGVARFLLLEIQKNLEKERRIAAAQPQMQPSLSDSPNLEQRAECLRVCLGKLSPGNRELVLQYYQGEKRLKIENRKRLTESLHLTVSTLRMRALRIRERLLQCVENCIS